MCAFVCVAAATAAISGITGTFIVLLRRHDKNYLIVIFFDFLLLFSQFKIFNHDYDDTLTIPMHCVPKKAVHQTHGSNFV